MRWWISPPASVNGLPCSCTSDSVSALRSRSISAIALRRRFARSSASVFCHVLNASCAAFTALSTSCTVPRGTSVMTSSVAGSTTGSASPAAPDVRSPAISISTISFSSVSGSQAAAAARDHHLARHVCHVIGSQGRDGRGDLLGLPHPAQRDARDHLAEHLLRHRERHLARGQARRDRVHSHAWRELERQRAGHAHEPALGGGVVELAEVAQVGAAREAHHGRAVSVVKRHCQFISGAEVDAYYPEELLLGHLDDARVAGDAGVVDQDVDRFRGLEDLRAILGLGDVGLEDAVARCEVDAQDVVLRAQAVGDRLADPASGAGDDRGHVSAFPTWPGPSRISSPVTSLWSCRIAIQCSAWAGSSPTATALATFFSAASVRTALSSALARIAPSTVSWPSRSFCLST